MSPALGESPASVWGCPFPALVAMLLLASLRRSSTVFAVLSAPSPARWARSCTRSPRRFQTPQGPLPALGRAQGPLDRSPAGIPDLRCPMSSVLKTLAAPPWPVFCPPAGSPQEGQDSGASS